VLAIGIGLIPLSTDFVIALRRIVGVRFLAPVSIGDTIHVEGRVSDLADREADGRLSGTAGPVSVEWAVLNQNPTTVCTATNELLWRREAPRHGWAPLLDDPCRFDLTWADPTNWLVETAAGNLGDHAAGDPRFRHARSPHAHPERVSRGQRRGGAGRAGFELVVPAEVPATAEPTAEELTTLRTRIDVEGLLRGAK
jgi:hypothetical protein